MKQPAGDVEPAFLLTALPAPSNLTGELVRRLAAEIRSSRLKPGERLPTEQELMRQAGVSRTVVREAIAALRAEGLVVTRQGVGAFVAQAPGHGLFRIDPAESASLHQVLLVFELRMGIEVEAAGLAAERRSAEHLLRVEAAHAAFAAAVERGEVAIEADFAFHRALFAATENQYFPRFLEFLGQIIIPRQSVRPADWSPREQRAYLGRVLREHGAVASAVRAGDAPAARLAMRRHLSNGRDRYRRMAASLADGATAAQS